MKHYLLLSVLILMSCQTQKGASKQKREQEIPSLSYYKNIKIYEDTAFTNGPCEPSIAINPINPKNMVAGSVLDNYHYSFDGGKTWTTKQLKSTHGVYGDPCIVNNSRGVFYYLHLANPDGKKYASSKFLNQIVIQRSQDGGKTWNDGSGIGKNEPKQQDKEWAAVHPLTGQLYVTWTEFDKYGSKEPKHKSRIRFATSTDGGKTFSKAITISEREGNAEDDDKTTEGAVPAIDKRGNIFVAWAYDNKLFFDKSTDGGKTWMKKDPIIATQPGGWTQDIPGVGRCNGMPVTAVDVSNSQYEGTIYVNWTDQRNGTDNTDVFLIKSKDQGKTWSQPIRVNRDTTNTHQFFTWMCIEPVTGFIYIVYYDRSRYANKKNKKRWQTDVVLAVSKDGGKSFSNKIISEKAFTPIPNIFFGDYNNISAYKGVVRPIWTRYEEGRLSIWTALIENP